MKYLPVLLLLWSAVPAYADILAGDLSQGFDNSNGLYVDAGLAVAFTSGVNSVVQSVTVAAATDGGSPDLTITLSSDNNGQPGAAIYTATQTGVLQTFGTSTSTITFNLATGLQLSNNQTYWLTLTGDPSALVWEFNSAQAHGPMLYTATGVTINNTLGGFEIDGTQTAPEPGTFLLAGCAAGVLFLRRRLNQ